MIVSEAKNMAMEDKNTMHAFLYICRAHILLNICKEAFQYKDAAMRTSIAIVLMAERKKNKQSLKLGVQMMNWSLKKNKINWVRMIQKMTT